MWCDACGHSKDVHGEGGLDNPGCHVGDCACALFIRRYAS